MSSYQFDTPAPVGLFVQIGRGRVHVTGHDTRESSVEVTGRDADQVVVEQFGDRISVVAPRLRTGFLGGESSFDVAVRVPGHSEPTIRTGSADVVVDGTVGSAEIKSGSGDVRVDTVTGPALLETGSGDVHVDVAASELRVKSGSGDISVGRAESALSVSTGSGDVEVGSSAGPAAVKTGSGDLRIGRATTDVSMTTGSGDLTVESFQRGRFTARGASGDVHVGVPAGIPVWTDLTSLSGDIRSDLTGAGRAAEGADHIELRARTVTGDIVLTQL